MKRISYLLLLSLFAPEIQAADLVPTAYPILDRDIARPFLSTSNSGDLVLSGGFEEASGYVLEPEIDRTSSSRTVRRYLNLGVRLPGEIELGFGLRDTQESTDTEASALYGRADHRSQPLSTAYWGRLQLFEGYGLRTLLTLQYEPGVGAREAYHQSSQDRSSIALAQEYSPLSMLHAAVFVAASRREDEPYQQYRLGDEISYGSRLTVGHGLLHAFVETQWRQLNVKKIVEEDESTILARGRIYKSGLGTTIAAFDFTASLLIPTTQRFLGVPERGFALEASYRFGAIPDQNNQSSKSTTESPLPNSRALSRTEPEHTLSTDEPDEFQLLEKKLQEDQKRPESPQEKAERELRMQREAEKIAEIKKAAEEEKRRREEAELANEQSRDDSRKLKKYSEEASEKIEGFGLPDADELNWNGLQD